MARFSDGDSGAAVRTLLNTLLAVSDAQKMLGTELISNTDFAANADGWTLGAGSTWSAGRITSVMDEAEAAVITTPIVGLQKGRTYLIVLEFEMTGDLNDIYFDHVSGEWASSGPGQAIMIESTYTGDEVLSLDFKNYAPGASRVITSASMREITTTGMGLKIRDYQTGDTVIDISRFTFNNIGIGRAALASRLGGITNIAIGAYALGSLTEGYDNVAIGQPSLGPLTEGFDNVAIGSTTMNACTTGSYNVVIGNNAGGSIVAGNSNIVIGSTADTPSDTTSYLNIGDVIIGDMVAGPLQITKPVIIMPPTSDPHIAGALWNNAGTPTISAG